jgi:hypothetical protein
MRIAKSVEAGRFSMGQPVAGGVVAEHFDVFERIRADVVPLERACGLGNDEAVEEVEQERADGVDGEVAQAQVDKKRVCFFRCAR